MRFEMLTNTSRKTPHNQPKFRFGRDLKCKVIPDEGLFNVIQNLDLDET